MTALESTPTAQKRINAARERRDKQLPDKYRIPKDKLPDESVKDVMGFPEQSGLMSSKSLEITNATALEILDKIQARQWTSEEVTEAFCQRAAYAHQLTNCLSEMFFDKGIERAKELDDYLAKNGKPMGPLHGLPISIKDNHHIVGTYAAVGLSKFTDKESTTYSALVSQLLDLGAVIYCKTTVPPAMKSPVTESALFGLTVNPKNRDHTVGGSSGGESALLTFKGSPIGIGSDIGGSIRIPCAVTGLYGLRGTTLRIPYGGTNPGVPGIVHLKSVIGPMARDLESVEFLCKVVYDNHPERYDNTCVPLPFREPSVDRKLKFGVILDDGVCKPTPPVARALDETIKALKTAGHEVVEWKPASVGKISESILTYLFSDGGRGLLDALDGDQLIKAQDFLSNGPPAPDLPSSQMQKLATEVQAIQNETFEQWKKAGFDGVIAPVLPVPAHPHYSPNYYGYTGYWNVHDYPSCSFPVTVADKGDEKVDYATRNKSEEEVWKDYDLEKYKGGDVGLQIVCHRYEDEKALALAGLIRDSLNK